MRNKLADLPASDFALVCRTSASIAEIIRRLGMAGCSSAYGSIRRRAEREGVSLSHAPRGLDSRKGMPYLGKRASLESVLASGSRNRIKQFLIEKGILLNVCAVCAMPPEWRGKPLVLRLDHINGNSRDDVVDNLRLVCPNCDSQLATFAGRNKKARIRTTCLDCMRQITQRSLRCSRCDGLSRRGNATYHKIKWPTFDELRHLLSNSNFSAVGRLLGVSDNAIRKHLRQNNTSPYLRGRGSVS